MSWNTMRPSLLRLLASCATTVGAGERTTIPEDASQVFEALGLELDALAVGKRHVDCICEPPEQ